jgi:1,4-alpha-glucan branching enzyme
VTQDRRGLGAVCIVLHGHLPWVLHHGRWPHGEDWLHEAVSETWLPLLVALEARRDAGLPVAWTVGFTPILLEQLDHPRFRTNFVLYLEEMQARARSDAERFAAEGRADFEALARRHEARFASQHARFVALDGRIAPAFGDLARSGHLEILSSNATHAYMPLLKRDACARAQVRAGLATSARHLGFSPVGVWLPECAYRPGGWWRAPFLGGDETLRRGVAGLFGDEGIQFLVIDAPTVARARPEGTVGPTFQPLFAPPDDGRAWGSTHEPHRVVEDRALTPMTVLARSAEVSQQVWSAAQGYPGDWRYLEFHKRHGMRGLRYWRVTSTEGDLGAKLPYEPEAAREAVHAQADHFARLVHGRLLEHRARTGRYGVVCAPFDAELFGHWWAEGVDFLSEVAHRLHANPEVDVLTVSQFLAHRPADKAVSLPEGSWGAGGDHRVWLHDEMRFYWELAWRAEDRFLDLIARAPWSTDPRARELLEEAGRQLLLLQASDWPFVISTGGAVDYGLRRLSGHAARFDDLCNGVEDRVAGRPEDPVVVEALRTCRAADSVFSELDLAWWT